MRFLRIAVVAAPLAAACGLSVTGELVSGGADGGRQSGAEAGTPGDIGTGDDAGVLVPEAGDPCAPCGFLAPPGSVLVGLGPRTAACPDVDGSADIVDGPDASTVCSCSSASCTIGTKPSCTPTAIATTYDMSSSTASCDQAGAAIPGNGGNCNNFESGSFGDHAAILAPTPQGTGTCTAPATANKAAASAPKARMCAGEACDTLCTAGLAAGFKACAAFDGEVACPKALPDRHVVGSDFDVTCGNCGTCTVTATGCTGTATFYSDSFCNNLTKTLTTGTCTTTNQANFGSDKWTGTPTGLSCNPSNPPPGGATIQNKKTLCCK